MDSKSKQLGVRVPVELFERVEAARGDVPRSRWVARALELAALAVEQRLLSDGVMDPEDARGALEAALGDPTSAVPAAPHGGTASGGLPASPRAPSRGLDQSAQGAAAQAARTARQQYVKPFNPRPKT